jgi:hypothetical protein
MSKGYTPHERFSLKNHPEYNERWVQDLIANDPSILGLGDLVLRDRERVHPRAGRLDLLLQDPDTKRRHEVELPLGSTDEHTSLERSNTGTSNASATLNTTTALCLSLRTVRVDS